MHGIHGRVDKILLLDWEMGEGRLYLEKKNQGVFLQKIPKEQHPAACTTTTGTGCWVPEPSPIESVLCQLHVCSQGCAVQLIQIPELMMSCCSQWRSY